MSRIVTTFLNNNEMYSVAGGWDPPFNAYHLTVFNLDSNSDDPTWDLWDKDWSCDDIERAKNAFYDFFPDAKIKDLFWERCSLKLGNHSENI